MNDSIPTRFEQIASDSPKRLALHSGKAQWTYRDLNDESNRIAGAIGRVLPGDVPARIALLFEQGISGIASTIGTLKSGHVFVPLDAADGSERMRKIIADCRPQVILTTREKKEFAESLAGGGASILCVDALPGDLSTANPEIKIEPERDAYIFYTSGSTGTPKGVRQTHRNLLHFMDVYSEALEVTGSDRLTLLYSPAFSASNMDLFGALLNGAALFPYDIRKRGVAALGDWIDENSITVLHAVPTVYRHLVSHLEEGRILETVRTVDLGGEAVFPSDVANHRDHFPPGSVLVNHLAATEASVIAQYKIDLEQDDSGEEVLPVGPPAKGMEVRIVSEDGSLAQTGERGEIVLSSPFISPGYWKRPELDERTFGEDPTRPGWRTYRTGDLGFLAPDGFLHFRGRMGQRVKVRGHTVDLSEVESAIHGFAGIREVAVVLREDQLVAFIEGPAMMGETSKRLTSFLRRHLPGYMIPSRYIVLDRLPSTASGKIDRAGLSRLDLQEYSSFDVDDPPRGETEERVAEIFSELLKREQVGRHDDFFFSGGDSLKATVFHAMVEKRFQKQVPLERLFVDATVRGIAALINRSEAGKTGLPPVIVPLRQSGEKPPLFLVHGGTGQAFVSPRFLSILGDDQPVYAFQATGLDRNRIRHNSIPEMAAEYIRAIKVISPSGPYRIGALCVGGLVAVEMALQLSDSGEAVDPLLLFDPPMVPPGDRDPLTRLLTGWRMLFRIVVSLFCADRDFSRRIRMRSEQGRNRINVNDGDAMKEATNAALRFRLAVLRYPLPDYPGPAVILASASRLAGTNLRAEASPWLQRLTGDLQIFNVGEDHDQVHDPENECFVEIVNEAMAVVDGYL